MNKYNVVKFQAPFERMKDYNLNPGTHCEIMI